MFSDEVIGLDIAHRRELKQMGQQSQAVIDSLDADVIRLRAKLQAAHDELAVAAKVIDEERAKRMSAELKLERLLNMKLN